MQKIEGGERIIANYDNAEKEKLNLARETVNKTIQLASELNEIMKQRRVYLLTLVLPKKHKAFDRLVYGKNEQDAKNKLEKYAFENYPHEDFEIQNNTIE